MNKKLLQEAIADANDVKEMALKQAKAALEEAFKPQIESMLASKLEEEEDLDEAKKDDEMKESKKEDLEENSSEDNIDEDIDLEEVLAFLESEEKDLDESKDDLDESKDKDKMKEGKKEDLEEAKDDDLDESIDLDEEIDIDALLQELLGEEAEDLEEAKKDKDLEEAKKDKDLEEAKKDEEMKEVKANLESVKADLKEAYNVINKLRGTLSEVNVMNAKLLYVNKLLKNNNLNESQKLKVLEIMDKATTTNEAKLVHDSLQESFASTGFKKSIQEGLGLASKGTGSKSRRKDLIKEDIEDPQVARFLKLANIG